MLIPFDSIKSKANVSELVYEPCLGHGALNGLRVRVSSFVLLWQSVFSLIGKASAFEAVS